MAATFTQLFTPKLVTVLREGYRWRHFRADFLAGMTVAIVALPLSMAIAIASGVSPDRGLTTAIVGGLVVSALGGSRLQVGGPAGAFIVLVAATVAQHGVEGLILATMMSGFILLAAGYLRLGTYIKFIPYPVTVGFTSGIAVIIFASQIVPLLGLTLGGSEPGPLAAKLPAIWAALPTFNVQAIVVAAGGLAIILAARAWSPKAPGMLIAVGLAALVTRALNLPIETIGSKYGGIPGSLPFPALPEFTLAKIQAVLPNAVSFALLGAIESLLSAVVADSMSGRRHRSNCELVAQGFANIGASLFGGFCVTGTIARTATNVRSGAHSPVAGMLHALFLLAFVLLAAPLAFYVPLAALAAVLTFVAWNMFERFAFAAFLRGWGGDAVVLVVTFSLTIFRDLTEAIVVGFGLGAVLFINRMSKVAEVETHMPFVNEDVADSDNHRGKFGGADPDVIIHRVKGAFFFGAAGLMDSVLDRIGDAHKALVLDFDGVPFLDSSAVHAIGAVVAKAKRQGVRVYISGTNKTERREMVTHGISPRDVSFKSSAETALAHWREAVR